MREESANVQYCSPDRSLEFVKSLGSYFRKEKKKSNEEKRAFFVTVYNKNLIIINQKHNRSA